MSRFILVDPSKPSSHAPRGHGRGRGHGQHLKTNLNDNPISVSSTVSAPAPLTPIEPMVVDSNPCSPPANSPVEDDEPSTILPQVANSSSDSDFPIANCEQDDEFDGDGLGCEEAEEEDLSSQAHSTASATPPRRSLPTYVTKAFTAYKSAYLDRDPNNLPKLYNSHHSFWVPQPSPLLQCRNSLSRIEPAMFYNPRFFIWDFLPLIDRIACPKGHCNGSLVRRGNRERPRRVVDFNSCYWLMGSRYQCNSCDTSFNSWDSQLLSQLEGSHPDIAAEFPAILTHWSGIDKKLFMFMSTCFSSGVGAKQFSDALRVQHKEMFDHQHMQYLQLVARGSALRLAGGVTFKAFGSFEGEFGGFVPSGQWLRDMWDDMMERRMPDIQQYMSMLPVRVFGMDHSHKVHISLLFLLISY